MGQRGPVRDVSHGNLRAAALFAVISHDDDSSSTQCALPRFRITVKKFMRRGTFLLGCILYLSLWPGWAQAPHINRIDPPGWWAQMPSPMLLVNGNHLEGAHFSVRGKGVTLTRTQISANGHWAFLWLDTSHAAGQTLEVVARTQAGSAQHVFALSERDHDPHAHRGFNPSDVMYLIMTDRFADGDPRNDQPGYDRSAPRGWHGGDLKGIEQHLDYLQQLGITTVWTTPVVSNAAMPDSYHGYAATDLYSVDSHFGTIADYRHLSDALHARGMKLVIDLAPNHLGILHPWIKDPPAPDWFHGTVEHHLHAQGDFRDLVDPHAPKQAWRAITEGWFTDSMPDLNQENPLVAQYLIQNAMWWVETANLDGIRLDTFPYVSRAFWHDFHAQLHGVYPDLTTVGEIFNSDPEITSFFAGGVKHNGIDTGLDTPFDFPVYFALRDVLTQNHSFTELARVLRQDALYPHPERLVPFIGNHDTSRFLTAANGSISRLELAFGLLITLRGMPLLYSGDEIAMPGGNDPDDRHDFPGGFPGDAQNAFTRTGRSATQEQVFSWVSGLDRMRKAHPVLESGIEQNLEVNDDVFAFVRTQNPSGCAADHGTERILIVVNKSSARKTIEINTADTALTGCKDFRVLAPTTESVIQMDGDKLQIEEPAESISAVRVD